MTPRISVLMAMDGRPGQLSRWIDAIGAQTLPRSAYEVVIVEASTRRDEATGRALAAAARARGVDVRYLPIEPGGRAKAWNVARRETRAPWVLLLGDDFVALPGLVEGHLAVHERDPDPRLVAVGPGHFREDLRDLPFRRWIEDTGEIYGASFTFPDPRVLSTFWYGANSSLARAFLDEVGAFREEFPYHSWDDHEMGERLRAAGAKIAYSAELRATHEHSVTLEERRGVLRQAGHSAVVYERLHPGTKHWHGSVRHSPWTYRWKRLQRAIRAALVRDDASRADAWAWSLREAFAAGYRDARRREGIAGGPQRA